MNYWPPDYTQTPGAYPHRLPRQHVPYYSNGQATEALLNPGWANQLQYAGYNPQQQGYYPHQQGGQQPGFFFPQYSPPLGIPGGANDLGYANANPTGYFSPYAFSTGPAATNTELLVASTTAINNLSNSLFGYNFSAPYSSGNPSTYGGGLNFWNS